MSVAEIKNRLHRFAPLAKALIVIAPAVFGIAHVVDIMQFDPVSIGSFISSAISLIGLVYISRKTKLHSQTDKAIKNIAKTAL